MINAADANEQKRVGTIAFDMEPTGKGHALVRRGPMSNLNALILADRYRKHDEVNSHPVETTVAFLVVFALGFGVGYGVRAQVSRNRRRAIPSAIIIEVWSRLT